MAYVLLTKGRAAFTALDGSGATRPSYSRLTENPITNPRNCAILSLRVEQTPLSPSTVEPWTNLRGFAFYGVAFRAVGQIKEEIAARRVERARSRIGMRTEYELGKGGYEPSAKSPGAACDCSGFVAWVLEISRKHKPSRNWWIETTQLVLHAKKGEVFVQLKYPEPGCIVAYGDSGGRQGHTGVVVAARSIRDFDVVDCSSGSWKRLGDAIMERRGTIFRGANSVFMALKQDIA